MNAGLMPQSTDQWLCVRYGVEGSFHLKCCILPLIEDASPANIQDNAKFPTRSQEIAGSPTDPPGATKPTESPSATNQATAIPKGTPTGPPRAKMPKNSPKLVKITYSPPTPYQIRPFSKQETFPEPFISFLTQAQVNAGEDQEPNRLLISSPTQTQHEAAENDEAEKKLITKHAAIHYNDVTTFKFSLQKREEQVKWRRLTTEIAHMFLKLDVRYFLYHHVSRKYIEKQVIPSEVQRNSETYKFIVDKLKGHLDFIETRQVRAMLHVLSGKVGADSKIEDWWDVSPEERGAWIEKYWDAQPKNMALFSNLIVKEVVDIDGIYASRAGEALQNFCKGKYLVSANYLFDAHMNYPDDGEYARCAYRRVPWAKEMKPFKVGVGKMGDIPVRQWIRDVQLDGFLGGGKKFIFTEWMKAREEIDTYLIKGGYLAPVHARRNKKCAKCHGTPTGDHKLMMCGRCGDVQYCGRICQRLDWMEHKKVCKVNEESDIEEEGNVEEESNVEEKE